MNRIHWLKASATSNKLQGSFSSIEVVARRRGFGYPWKSVRINLLALHLIQRVGLKREFYQCPTEPKNQPMLKASRATV
jgi:hypothetical protein